VAETLPPLAGELRRFVLEQQPVRGFWVQLGAAWGELRRYRQHEPPVEALLGEAVSAAVLLAATLKFEGVLTLQLAGGGAVPMLVAQCTHTLAVRATVRSRSHVAAGASFRELVGEGRLTVTLEAAEQAARYQGIVALDGTSLAACLEAYFATSEQLPTRLRLHADAGMAAGMLLQKLPGRAAAGEVAQARVQQAWEDLQVGLAGLAPLALSRGTVSDVLPGLCGEHDCRVFAATAVRCECRCSPERVASMLRSLGAAELRAVLAQEGTVTVTCEFCGRPYRYDAVDVEGLFAGGGFGAAPASIN
jgi:molecular chaperone Hsp33